MNRWTQRVQVRYTNETQRKKADDELKVKSRRERLFSDQGYGVSSPAAQPEKLERG